MGNGLLCGQAWNPVDYDKCMKAAKDVFALFAGQSTAKGWFENVFCAGNDAIMFTMHDFENWVECQGMAGLLHGNTLSFTRLIFTKYCQFGGDWESENFDPKFSASSAAVGTLMGLEEEHAINQAEPVENTEFYDMMKTLQALTADMQEDFWKNLTAPEKEQFTWVLSVWGPNMLDQTQLTISTYV